MRNGVLVMVCVLTAACGSSNNSATGSGGAGSNTPGGSGSAGGPAASAGNGNASAGATTGPLTPLPPSQIPPVDPTAVVIPNLDSAVINIEAVAGAKDYRAFVIKDGVEVLTDADNREVVNGATIFCAGLRQHSAPALPEPEVMQQIEVTDLREPTEYVVEAIDQLCPFPGVFGTTDTTVEVTSPDAIQYWPELVVPFPIVSEATIVAKYGSMIINGQGGNKQHPGFPADPVAPKVLKRWKVKVSPLDEAAAAKRRTKTFFEDFSQNDPPTWVSGGENGDDSFHAPFGYGYGYAVYQNSKFAFYATNTQVVKGNHFFYDRGQLQTNLPDAAQDTMGALMAVAKTPAHFSDDAYLHVTFEGSTNSSARRYWWLSLCGAPKAGDTFRPDGLLSNYISLGSGFWNPDAQNPSVGDWNCLLVFPHDGLSAPVPSTAKANPESSVIVVIHKGQTTMKQSAVNVSPQQVNAGYPAAWYRQMKAGQVTEVGILDDLLQTAPRIHFDMYISRNRLVMYVNGQQRLCNDFGEQKLTMPEAAVGFNNALYHSSAEHGEFYADFANRTGQRNYLENDIFIDQHPWDNVGFEENVALPDSYSDADCYTYKP